MVRQWTNHTIITCMHNLTQTCATTHMHIRTHMHTHTFTGLPTTLMDNFGIGVCSSNRCNITANTSLSSQQRSVAMETENHLNITIIISGCCI